MRYFYTIVIIFSFYSCTQHKTKNRVEPVKNEFRNIVFKGVTDGITKFKSIDIANLSGYTQNASVAYKNNAEISDSTFFTFKDSVDNNRQFIRMVILTQDSIYSTSLFVNPRDTVSFQIKNKKLKFKGPKSDEYNFYSNLRDSVGAYNTYKGNLQNFKNYTDSIYEKKTNFLENYIKTHEINSKDFHEVIANNLRYDYLFELLKPTDEGLLSTILNEYKDSENLFDFDNYFGDLELKEFQDQTKLPMFSFRNTLYYLVSVYFDDSGYVPFSREKFIEETKFIEENFNPELKEIIYPIMFFEYAEHGFGKSIENAKFFKKTIKKYKNEYSNSSLIVTVDEIYNNLNLIEFKLPDKVLNTQLLNLKGDTLSFKQVLKNSKNSIKVLDIWATWCPPCITDIEQTTFFREELSKKYNVDWIYLSIDPNKDEWINKCKLLENSLQSKNIYFLLKGKKSALTKYLNIIYIPNYVILDENNNILINKSSSPRHENLFLNIIKDIQN